ncbi:hypothetical protein ACFL1B_03365 [Nanoarchaeota archaeon]
MDDNLKIQKLADQFLSTGLAKSKMHALEMAESIAGTSAQINKDFEAKKEDCTTGIKRREPTTKIADNEFAQKRAEEMRQNAMDRKPLEVQADYQTPKYDSGHAVAEPKPEYEEPAEPEPEYEEPAEPEPSYDNSSDEELSVQEVEEAPKRDLSSSPESSVDLTEMFKFGK